MAVPPFVAGAVLTAAQLNALLALGKTKKVTATGNVTTTDLPAGQAVIMIGWAGGGGSGGVAATTSGTNAALAGGGGSGAFGITVVPYVSVVWPLTVTIGAAGAAGAVTPGNGGTGGTTTVIDTTGAGTTWLSLAGGTGGQGAAVTTAAGVATSGGGGGAVTTATFGVTGGSGGNGYALSATAGYGGDGGAAPMGGQASPGAFAPGFHAGGVGVVPGGGGSGTANGGTAAAAVGAVGARGEVWFIVV